MESVVRRPTDCNHGFFGNGRASSKDYAESFRSIGRAQRKYTSRPRQSELGVAEVRDRFPKSLMPY